LHYWRNRLSVRLSEGIALERICAGGAEKPISRDILWGRDLTAALRRIARNDDLAFHLLSLGILHLVIERLGVGPHGAANVVLCPVSGETPSASGPVIASVTGVQGQRTFRDFLLGLRQAFLDAHEHACLNLDALRDLADLRQRSALGRYGLYSTELHGQALGEEWPWFSSGQLIFGVGRAGERTRCTLHFSEGWWDASTAEGILKILTRIAGRVARDPRRSTAEITRLPLRESQIVRTFVRGSHRSLKQPATVIGMFEAAAKMYADRPALATLTTRANLYDSSNPSIRRRSITFGSLNSRANQIAHALRSRGIGPGDRVALLLDDPIRHVEGILGVLKAGAAYLAIDPLQTEALTDRQMREAGCALLLTEDARRKPAAHTFQTNQLELHTSLTGPDHNLSLRIHPSDVCYICHTSGTTGASKPVAIEHGGLANYVRWRLGALAIASSDVALQIVPWTADGSGSNLFPTLCAGALVVVGDAAVRAQPKRAAALMSAFNVTLMSLVPSVYRALLPELSPQELKKLRALVLAGEPLPADLVMETLAREPMIKIYNEYGPTEATIAAAFGRVKNAETALLIGRPIDNTRLLIANATLEPMPIGIPGEIYVSGVGVARGYLNDPRLTHEHFVRDRTGRRWYRTYDVGKWSKDGAIRFLRRLDRTVKRRGQRLSLDALEAEIRRTTGSTDVFVESGQAMNGDGGQGKRLRAWVGGVGHLDAAAVKRQLGMILPDHMIPDSVHGVPVLPRLGDGRVDTAALNRLTRSRRRRLNRTETMVADLFRDLLGLSPEDVTADSNFFELGGHSLLVTQLAGRIQAKLRINLRISEIYNAPTVSALARKLAVARRLVQQDLQLRAPADMRSPGERSKQSRPLPTGGRWQVDERGLRALGRQSEAASSVIIPAELQAGIHRLAIDLRTSPSNVLLAALADSLAPISIHPRGCIWLEIAPQPTESGRVTESLLMLPISCIADPAKPFRDVLRAIKYEVMDAFAHQGCTPAFTSAVCHDGRSDAGLAVVLRWVEEPEEPERLPAVDDGLRLALGSDLLLEARWTARGAALRCFGGSAVAGAAAPILEAVVACVRRVTGTPVESALAEAR
jgi:amino acid adenylation domain-containing protein